MLDTATYTATRCHLCNQSESRENNLIHDGKSFLICADATACLSRVERIELAEYFRLQEMAKCLRDRLNTVLTRQGELEMKLGLYDQALAEHRAEMAKIEEGTR